MWIPFLIKAASAVMVLAFFSLGLVSFIARTWTRDPVLAQVELIQVLVCVGMGWLILRGIVTDRR